ncbi:MAG: hypothetical protein DYH02_13005 [Candidatus Omnitrophica bacterium COP1]|nr:hypothetical protein [Candidatus Omnitrophica bacterium COP1]
MPGKQVHSPGGWPCEIWFHKSCKPDPWIIIQKGNHPGRFGYLREKGQLSDSLRVDNLPGSNLTLKFPTVGKPFPDEEESAFNIEWRSR